MVKNALFRNVKLQWVTTEGLWLPCESFQMAGTAVQVGMCWSDTGTCHTAVRTNNMLKGKKIHSTLKGQKARQACSFGGKNVSLSREGNRMVIGRTALNYLGPQQFSPASSP